MSISNIDFKHINGFYIGKQSGYHVTVPEVGEFKYNVGIRGKNFPVTIKFTDDDITVYPQKYDDSMDRYRPYLWTFNRFIGDRCIKNKLELIQNVGSNMRTKNKIESLITSLEEISENCLDNIEYENIHKQQLSNAEMALEGFIELQNTVNKLEEAGVKVEEDIASSLYHLASPKIDKDPIMKITFESFGDKGDNFKGFIEERISTLKEFILKNK